MDDSLWIFDHSCVLCTLVVTTPTSSLKARTNCSRSLYFAILDKTNPQNHRKFTCFVVKLENFVAGFMNVVSLKHE